MQGVKGSSRHGTIGHYTGTGSVRCRCPLCREAWRIYQKQAQRKRSAKRMAVLRRYKLKLGCRMCGFRGHHAALTFDHRDPTTKVHEITRSLSGLKWTTIKAEVRKCQILCFNCHMIKTHENKESNSAFR